MGDRLDSHSHRDHGAGRIALAGGLAMLAILAAPLCWGRFYLYDDLLTFHLPLRVFYGRCLALGDDPRWFPGYFRGFDLHGEGQIGLLHPVHVPLYGVLPVSVALPIEFMLNYVFLFVGTVLFLRRWVGLAGSAEGGLAATFFGYAILHFMHINSVGVLAHLPWALLFSDRVLRGEGGGRSRARAGVALALVVASAMLLGHPQTVWYIGLIGLFYCLAVAFWERAGRRLVLVSGFAVIGVLMGGAQLLPMWDAAGRSTRATMSESGILLGSLHPLNLCQLLAPYGLLERYVPGRGGVGAERFIHRHELGSYPGAAVAPLLIWLFLRWRGLAGPGRRLAGAGLALAGLGLVLALGDYGPAGPLLTRLPLVRQFRVPARYVLLVQMGLSAAVAVAVEDLSRRRAPGEASGRRGRLIWLAAGPLLTVVCLAVLVWASGRPPEGVGPPGTPARLAFNLLLAVGAAGLVALASYRPRLGLGGLLLLALVDATAYGLYFHVWDQVVPLREAISARVALPPMPAGTRLHVGPADPVHAPGRPSPGSLILSGARLTGGYVALEPSRRLALEGGNDDAIRLAGASWSWDDGQGGWRAISRYAPRARAVARTARSLQPARVPEGFDAETEAVVDAPVALDLGAPGRVWITRDRPGRIELTVESVGRRLLVLNEAYHPGWAARLDGSPATVLRVDYDAMGVVLPAGRHRVALRFQPSSFRRGVMVSAAGLAGLVLLWLAARRW